MGILTGHSAGRGWLAAAAAVCLWAGFGARAPAATEPGAAAPATTLELKGLLIPLDQANLSSRSTGVIREMKKEGDVVRQGDVVVHLEDDAEKLAVQGSQAMLDKRRFDADSATKLHAKGSSSEDDERTADTNLKTADIQLQEAEIALDKKTVKAPFDGVVTHRIRAPGEAVDQYFPLLTMVNLAQLYLECYLPANRIEDVQPGQAVEVRVADLPGRIFTGHVEFIAPVIDPASGEFRIKILIPNADHVLRSGMSAAGILQLTHAAPAPAANPNPAAPARNTPGSPVAGLPRTSAPDAPSAR